MLANLAKYSPGSGDVGNYQDFLHQFKQGDRQLYDVYQDAGGQALYALYRIATIAGLQTILDYRPVVEDIIRLSTIIAEIPENYRQDYVAHSFRQPVSLIIGGSAELPLDSVLYFANISDMLNIPWFVINNNRNSKFSRESDDLVISELSLNLRNQINRLIVSQKYKHENVWVDIESLDQLETAIDSIISSEYQLVNLFIVTHGTKDSLIFSTSSGKSFSVSPRQLSDIADSGTETSLFLGTCYSGIFAKNMNIGPDLAVVTSSDKIAVDGDLTTSILLSLNRGDYRINEEDLKLISSQEAAYKQDNYCYYYYEDGREYRIIDDKVTHAHKVRFGYKDSQLDIRVINSSGSSLLYFHTRSILDK
ncbi:MAG: hypothetical protein U5N58_08240 [Actinomycetota bacterium]|nr:hypothetical protein [Actinomycetota bacterium]